MLKYLLFGVYAFSIVYCYMQFMAKIQECVDAFIDKHPEIPIKKSDMASKIWFQVEVVLISAIPLLNIFLAYFLNYAGGEIIDSAVANVEARYATEFADKEEDEEQ